MEIIQSGSAFVKDILSFCKIHNKIASYIW